MDKGVTPLETRLAVLPRTQALVDLRTTLGPIESWRLALSQGGIDPAPLPNKLIDVMKKLGYLRIRVFIQEFFRIYDTGHLNWELLDEYMGALEATGAKVVAALTIKPRTLFSKIDERVWRPNNVDQWQALVKEIVKRYGGKRGLITHWEIGNEPNIGEAGGAPYLIPDPIEYFEYFKMTSEAIRAIDPSARVGGPAVADAGPMDSAPPEPLPGFVSLCKQTGTQLDFVSWHNYCNDAAYHADSVRYVKKLVEGMDPTPELFVTEWNKSFPAVSVADIDGDWGWAGSIVSIGIALLDVGIDWAFYYHVWDQAIDPEKFSTFLSKASIKRYLDMFNMKPLRLGMFDQEAKVRAPFFALQTFARLKGDRVKVEIDDFAVKAIASLDKGNVTLVLASDPYATQADRIVDVAIGGDLWHTVDYDLRMIDHRQDWDTKEWELTPREERKVWTSGEFKCQVYLPAGAVAIVHLGKA